MLLLLNEHGDPSLLLVIARMDAPKYGETLHDT